MNSKMKLFSQNNLNRNSIWPMPFSIQIISLFQIVLICQSCEWSNRSIDKDYYNQNFDDLQAWSKYAELAGGNAHSGMFCTYADSTHPVSQTFEMDLRLAYYFGYKRFDVSAWVLHQEKEAKGALVGSIATFDSTIVKIEKAEIQPKIFQAGVWYKIEMSLDIPQHLPDTNRVRVFLWSPEGDRILMDDISVHGIR